MTQAKKKIILLTTGLILTICLMAFFGVYALTILKNSTFNVGVKYEPEYLVKVEMGIDGANGGTVNQTIEETEYVEIFNSLNPVSNGMYIDSMSNETIHINSQTLTPIGANGDVYFRITSLENETSNETIHINSQTLTPIGGNGDVYFRITSLENETSGNKDLQCVIDCGSSTANSGKLVIKTPKILTIATGIDATNETVTSSSLGMIKINLKFSEVLLLDLKYLVGNDATGLDFGEAGKIETNVISGTTFYVSNIDGLLNLSALVGQVNTTTTEYGSNYGYDNSAGPAVTFSGATIQMLNDIDCENGDNFSKTFISIGNGTNSFQGTFDGNDKTITSLYINQTTDNVGLFGYVSNAEIKDLTMQNCKVVSTGQCTGNFVGRANNSSISNCSAEDTTINGEWYVGGIIGCLDDKSAIINSCNIGRVEGNGYYYGGIAGLSVGIMENCYNIGRIEGNGYYYGGLVGYINQSTALITNCYNTGSVQSAKDYSGGIVGRFFGGGVLSIINCYSISTNVHGGIVFSSTGGGVVKLINSYYLKTDVINFDVQAIGTGSVEIESYYGKFG